MKTKREIYALDYAISELVSALNHLFSFAVNPLGKFSLGMDAGLNVEMETNQMPIDVKVSVRPVSWDFPSSIFIRFRKEMGAWKAFEGSMNAWHLPEEYRFVFECSWDYSNSCYRFSGTGTEDEALLKRLLSARASAEAKQRKTA